MAQIITYPKLSTLADKDLLLVSDVSSKNKTTNSLEVDTLAQYIITTNSLIKGGGSFNRIPLFTPTGAEIGNSIMVQSSGGNEIQVGGDLIVTDNANIDNNLEVDGDLNLNGVGTFDSITQFFGQATFEDEANFQSTIKDQFSNPGTAGQVLSSTGSNVEWIDNTSGGGGIGGSGTVNTIAMFTPDGTTIGDSPITNPSFSNIELGGSLTIGQFSYLYWGNSSSDRLSIQNNISGSDIRQTGSGALSIQCDSEVSISAAAAIGGSEALAKFKENGPIELYYDNVKTFETTSAGAQVLGDFTLLDTTTSNPVILSLSEQTVGEQFQGAFLNLRARETSTNTETRGVVVAHGPNSINTGGAGNVVVQNQTAAGGQVVIAPKSGPVGNPPQSITYFNRFKENGQVQFPGYGSGTLTGTAAYSVSVDASGNLIETPNIITQTKGTYTPELVCSNSDLTVNTYSAQVGRWVRVGDIVTCEFTIIVSLSNLTITDTASTATVKIQGTPYDAVPTSSPVTGYISYSRGFELSLSDVIVLTGTSYTGNLNFQPGLKNTSITNQYLPDDLRVKSFANVGSTFQIQGSYTYVTNTSTLNPGAAVT